MANRYIFDREPDATLLFDEMFREGTRDYKGLELGDVSGHAERRFTASYGAMQLVALLVQLDRLPADVEIGARGASEQDKQVGGAEQAAHILPRELVVLAPGKPAAGKPLYEYLNNPLNQIWVRRHLFAPTDRVNRLVNVADSSCERGPEGMAAALVELCNKTLEDARRDRKIILGAARPPSAYARNRFQSQLVPCYRMVASLRRFKLEQAMTDAERLELNRSHPVFPDGRPLVPRPTDTRLGSKDPQARAAAKITLRQILKIYEEVEPDEAELADVAGKIDALRFNENVAL